MIWWITRPSCLILHFCNSEIARKNQPQNTWLISKGEKAKNSSSVGCKGAVDPHIPNLGPVYLADKIPLLNLSTFERKIFLCTCSSHYNCLAFQKDLDILCNTSAVSYHIFVVSPCSSLSLVFTESLVRLDSLTSPSVILNGLMLTFPGVKTVWVCVRLCD